MASKESKESMVQLFPLKCKEKKKQDMLWCKSDPVVS